MFKWNRNFLRLLKIFLKNVKILIKNFWYWLLKIKDKIIYFYIIHYLINKYDNINIIIKKKYYNY